MTDQQRRGSRWLPRLPTVPVGGRPFAVLTDLLPGSTGSRTTGAIPAGAAA